MASGTRFALSSALLLGLGPLLPAPAGAALTDVTYQITGGTFTIDRQEVIAIGGTVHFRFDTYGSSLTLLTFELTGTSNRMKFANPAGKSGFYGGRRATFLLGAAFTQVLTGPALSRADFFRIRGGCCGGRFTPNGGADFGFYLGSYDADRHALVDVTGVEVSRVSEPWALPALAAALGALLVALATGAGLLRRTAP